MKNQLLVLGIIGLSQITWAAEPLSLDAALSKALKSNPEIGAYGARAEAEHAAIRSQYSPENPRFGLFREQNLTFMQLAMGPMTSWSVSQEIKFPAKYFLMGSAQKAKAAGTNEELASKKLEVRQKVISTYYSLFANLRILMLLEAQKETLREVARIAETRHATGKVPQQDEMKAHLEQTKIETEILLIAEERDALEAKLSSLMNEDDATGTQFLIQKDLAAPTLTTAVEGIPKIAHASANHIRHGKFLVEEATTRKSLAYLNYTPDFFLTYRRAFINSPDNAYAFGVELSIPLWFFAKQSSEVSAASAKQIEAEKNLEKTVRDIHAEVRALTAKVKGHEKLIQIYKKALIPQTTSTLSSSRTAYQAGRAGFLDLLDSERSVYEIQVAYYRTLAQYVSDLTQLEEMVGSSLSNLPFGGDL